ncbi:unnamed protein product [Candida verbasci]|uniref:SEC7 domain-containing protein n=1 Tax=Candida verbasci TaxID=1227364 RepID=A0A9W4TX13_9ASCO|nr:unnamed protein product [Candida verbasci]
MEPVEQESITPVQNKELDEIGKLLNDKNSLNGLSNLSHNFNSRLYGIDPKTLVINECMILASAMRKTNRWSQNGVASLLSSSDIFGKANTNVNYSFNDDEDGLTNAIGSTLSHGPKSDKNLLIGSNKSNNTNNINNLKGTHDNPLLASFLQLKSILIESQNLYDIDSLTLLQPFLLIIKSSSTSGYITGLSLRSISKFLTYSIISFKSKNLQSSLIQIVSSLTHCRFEAADQNSDDAVLLKVLRLLEDIIKSSLSSCLPNELMSEVIHTCLSLACNKKRSEVLRRAAEMAMISITVELFTKLHEIEPELEHGNDDIQPNLLNTQLPEDLIGGTNLKSSENLSTNEFNANVSDQQKTDTLKEEYDSKEKPFSIVCYNEFFAILISMISPSNQFHNMESSRVFALSLINSAVEVAGLDITKHSSLLTMISDPISKHVLQIITTTESISLLKESLQLFSTIAIVLGRELKPQLELSITLIFQSILPPNSKQLSKDNDLNVTARTSISKEVLIESISLLWTRSSIFFTDLFIDYDCDFENSDLSIKVLDYLCQLSLPESAVITTDSVPPLCLEGILSFISGVHERSKTKSKIDKPLHQLIENRNKKTAFIRCTESFNKKPKEGIKALAKEGFLKDENDLKEVAEFFYSKSGRLNKKKLGEYLTEPKNKELFNYFIKLFEFTDLRPDEALRVMLKSFRLPGESQQIDRTMEAFAEWYVECQKNSTSESNEEEEESVLPDKDSAFVLAFSIILLNTDLHNPQVKKHMSLEDYKKNLRGVYNGKDFPEWYISKIYSSIKDREIIMPEEHHGTDKWFDDIWHNMVSTQNLKQMHKTDLENIDLCQFDKELFNSLADTLINTIIRVFKEATDDHVITRLMSSVDKIASICLQYDLIEPVDKLISILADLTTITTSDFKKDYLDDNIRENIPITQMNVEKQEGEIYVSELAVWFGRDFKAQLATVVLFRIIRRSNCKIQNSWEHVLKIILKLFEYCLIDPNLYSEFQKKVKLDSLPKVKPEYSIRKTKPLNNSGLLSTFQSFLRSYSDDPPEPTDVEIESTLSTVECVKSLNIPSIFAMVSQCSSDIIKSFITILLSLLPELNNDSKRYYETELLFIYEVCVCFCLLLNDQSMMGKVIEKFQINGLTKKSQLRMKAYDLLLLRKCENKEKLITAITSLKDLDKELLSKQGGQIFQPLISLIDEDSWSCKILLDEEEYWKSLRIFGSFQVYAAEIINFLDSFVKNSTKDITFKNYVLLLGLLDEISSLGALGSQFEQGNANSTKDQNAKNNDYFKDLITLSKHSIDLTAILVPLVKEDEFKGKGVAYSAIQALAHQCFNPCRELREYAVKTIQNIILSFEFDSEVKIAEVFDFGLFPLLFELTKPEVIQSDVNGFEKTQFELFNLVSKTYLKQFDYMTDEDKQNIWLGLMNSLQNFQILDESKKGKYYEPSAEVLKNLVLVLQNNRFLIEDHSQIYNHSWNIIDKLTPGLRKDSKIEEMSAEQISNDRKTTKDGLDDIEEGQKSDHK